MFTCLLDRLHSYILWRNQLISPCLYGCSERASAEATTATTTSRTQQAPCVLLAKDEQSEQHKYNDFDDPPGHVHVQAPLLTPEPPPSPSPDTASDRGKGDELVTINAAIEASAADTTSERSLSMQREAPAVPQHGPSAGLSQPREESVELNATVASIPDAQEPKGEAVETSDDVESDNEEWTAHFDEAFDVLPEDDDWLEVHHGAPITQVQAPTAIASLDDNPFATLPVESTGDEDVVSGPTKPKVQLQGKQRTKSHVRGTEPVPDLSSTIELALRGRLFQHACTLLGDGLAHNKLIATVDSGAEVVAIDAKVFDELQIPLGLPLIGGAPPVTMANNTSHSTAGSTSLRIQVGDWEDTVNARVIDSGGAFQILLGKPWLAQMRAIMFFKVYCIMQPISNGRYGKLWNQNPKAAPAYTAIPDDPEQVARWCMQREIKTTISNMQVGEFVGEQPHDDAGRFPSPAESEAASRRVLQMMLEAPSVNFWNLVEGATAAEPASASDYLPTERSPRAHLGAIPAQFLKTDAA